MDATWILQKNKSRASTKRNGGSVLTARFVMRDDEIFERRRIWLSKVLQILTSGSVACDNQRLHGTAMFKLHKKSDILCLTFRGREASHHSLDPISHLASSWKETFCKPAMISPCDECLRQHSGTCANALHANVLDVARKEKHHCIQESGDVQIWCEDLWHLPAHLSDMSTSHCYSRVCSGWFHLQACKVECWQERLADLRPAVLQKHLQLVGTCSQCSSQLCPDRTLRSQASRRFCIISPGLTRISCTASAWKNGTVMMSGNAYCTYCTVAFLTYEAMNGFFSPSLSLVLWAFPCAFIGLNEARLPRLLQGLPHAFEKHATGCGSMLRTNCCVRTLVHLLRCDVGG